MSMGNRGGGRSSWATIGWVLLAIHAVGLGLYSLRYLLPEAPFAIDLPNFTVRQNWLVAHATF
jgi:hypothetical protein